MAPARSGSEAARASEGTDLFSAVVAACGLAVVIGPGTVRRALQDIGASSVPTVDDFRRAVPRLEMRLAVYLSPAEAAQRALVIQKLLDDQTSSFAD